MKRYVAIILIMCLAIGTAIPVNNLIVWAASQTDNTKIDVDAISEFGDMGEDKSAEVGGIGAGESDKNGSAEAGESDKDGDAEIGDGGTEPGAGGTGDGDTETDAKQEGDVIEYLDIHVGDTEIGAGGTGAGKTDKDGGTEAGESDKNGDAEAEKGDGDTETDVNQEKDEPEDENKNINIEEDAVYLDIYVDEYRNVEISASSEIRYYVVDNFGKDDNYEECDIVIFFGTDEGVELREDDIFVTIPFGWSYEIDMESGTVTITQAFMRMMALSSRIESVRTFNDLATMIDNINNNRNGYTELDTTIRILEDINFTGAGIPVRLGNKTLRIVADNRNRKIRVDRGSVFAVQSGTLIISGGSEGGTLEFEGWNNPMGGSTCLAIQTGGVVEVHSGVIIRDFVQSGVHVNGGTFRLYGDAHLLRNRWVFSGNGGGVRIANGGLFEMYGGIIERGTAQRGGGVHVADGSRFHMYGGQIIDCFAIIDGGGVYVENGRYENVTIARAAVLSGNVAQNGKRIDNSLPERFPLINPGTVSIPGNHQFLADGENFITIPAHAFTNYDVNTTGSQYWRVTSEAKNTGGSNGRVIARITENGVLVPDRAFVPEGTEISFFSEDALIDRWEIGTRVTETDQDKRPIAFSFVPGGSEVPLVHTVTRYTHVVGHFSEGGVTITFDPNGGLGEPYVLWTRPGSHVLTHEVAHENEAFTHMGWICENGVEYLLGQSINVTEDITLRAKWGRDATTLTVSKEVTGGMGDQNREFEFTIIFTDAEKRPLATQRFNYIGGIIEGMDATAPENGELALDDEGKATFWLKHGQSITIEDVALNISVQIIEEEDLRYITTFIDSENEGEPITGKDTGMLTMTENREFHFINNREASPASGISMSNTGGKLLMVIGIMLIIGMVILKVLWRRLRLAQKHPIGCIG